MTTVRLLNGVLRPGAGTSRVLGLDPWPTATPRRRTGVLTRPRASTTAWLLENVVIPAHQDAPIDAERRARCSSASG
jgi:ABC-type uncharacterized transport system ATPase subunit